MLVLARADAPDVPLALNHQTALEALVAPEMSTDSGTIGAVITFASSLHEGRFVVRRGGVSTHIITKIHDEISVEVYRE